MLEGGVAGCMVVRRMQTRLPLDNRMRSFDRSMHLALESRDGPRRNVIHNRASHPTERATSEPLNLASIGSSSNPIFHPI